MDGREEYFSRGAIVLQGSPACSARPLLQTHPLPRPLRPFVFECFDNLVNCSIDSQHGKGEKEQAGGVMRVRVGGGGGRGQ